MKYLSFIFCFSFSLSVLACSCVELDGWAFCNLIKSDYFIDGDGIVCIVEPTGNVSGGYLFSAAEVKIVELLYGQVQPGGENYLNTDSTIWIIAGSEASCYKRPFFLYNPNEQFVIAPTYSEVYGYNTIETGYFLEICTNDAFRYTDPMIGAIINDGFPFPNPDTITINQLPQVVESCAECLADLTLSGTHDFFSIYRAGSTILSTATIDNNIIYKANDRVTLSSDFKTNLPYSFSVRMDGCD